MDLYVQILMMSSLTLFTSGSDIGYFWHLTDQHWDPTYDDPGLDRALSCGDGDGDQYGIYGDYLCDPPIKLVRSSVEAMKEIHPDPDFLIWTGDDTPHIWNDTILDVPTVEMILANLTDVLLEVFPSIRVYAALGNHDWSPKNQLPPHQDPLYHSVADMWQSWLDSEANTTFRQGGYYSQMADGANIRIIVLNTNLYYDNNEATEGVTDPAGQFSWLETLLEKAMEDGEQVMLVLHVPPGMFEKHRSKHWFRPECNDRFTNIIRQYSSVIGSIHAAHHHTDSFRMVYDDEGEAVSSILLAPAVTPWETTLPGVIGGAANNPAIRLVKYNRTSGGVLDVYQYYLNLTLANLAGEAEWVLEYQGTEYFNQTDMGTQALHNISEQLLNDDHIWQNYLVANGVLYDPNEHCEDECRHIHYCSIKHLNYDDYEQCVESLPNNSNAPSISAYIMVMSVIITLIYS